MCLDFNISLIFEFPRRRLIPRKNQFDDPWTLVFAEFPSTSSSSSSHQLPCHKIGFLPLWPPKALQNCSPPDFSLLVFFRFLLASVVLFVVVFICFRKPHFIFSRALLHAFLVARFSFSLFFIEYNLWRLFQRNRRWRMHLHDIPWLFPAFPRTSSRIWDNGMSGGLQFVRSELNIVSLWLLSMTNSKEHSLLSLSLSLWSFPPGKVRKVSRTESPLSSPVAFFRRVSMLLIHSDNPWLSAHKCTRI